MQIHVSLFEEDTRFLYDLTDSQQLLYFKLIYLALKTANKIPVNGHFITNKVNYRQGDEQLNKDLQAIMSVFPKFYKEGGHYCFENFERMHNYIVKKPHQVVEKFHAPTVDEIKKYCVSRDNKVDPQKFYDYYEARGWLLSKDRHVKDWKACVRTWERNTYESERTGFSTQNIQPL
jgi:hypothetical protein